MPLHLYKAFTGIFHPGFVGRYDDVLMLHHIPVLTGAGLNQPIAFGAECVIAVVLTMVQHIMGKGFFIHALADNAHLHPAVGGDARIERAKLRQNVLLGRVALHGVVDVADLPHSAEHISRLPHTVRIDSINRNALLHRSRHFIAAACFSRRCVLT